MLFFNRETCSLSPRFFPQERNKLLKRIVGKITYNREDNNVYLRIQYN